MGWMWWVWTTELSATSSSLVPEQWSWRLWRKGNTEDELTDALCFFCSFLSLDFPQWVFNGMFREVNSWFRSSFWFKFISLKSMTLIRASHWLLIDCYRSMSVETLTGRILWEKQLPNIIFSRTAAFKTLLEGRFAEPMPNLYMCAIQVKAQFSALFRLFLHSEFRLWPFESKGIRHCVRFFF